MRKLGAQPGESVQTGFQLPEYAEKNLSNAECAEKLALFFSTVSQEYQPLNVETLPPNVKEYLTSSEPGTAPELSHHDVFMKLRKAKKPNSVVPGDLPRKLVQRFTSEITIPVISIFNRITQSQDYRKFENSFSE